MKKLGIPALLICLLYCNLSFAAGFPYTLHYQGTLTGKAGEAVNEPQDITFNLYTTAIGAEAPFWTESIAKVPLLNSQISATLGTVTPLDPSKFSGETYLGIKIGTQPEMLPRQKMTSVPYAFHAVNALNGIPKGGVIMWSGSVEQVPAGWALCDGRNGTPDLRDRFVVGVGNRFGSGKLRNITGGEEEHRLTASEMPAHNHAVANYRLTLFDGGATSNGRELDNIGLEPHLIANAGSDPATVGDGAAHNNLPPYYALAFIIKL